MDDNTSGTGSRDKKLQDDLMESAHRIWLAGLGALATAEAEGSKVFSRLVERGKDVETRGKDAAADVKEQAKSTYENVKSQTESAWSGLGDKVDETLTTALHRLGVPTRDEIRNLTQKIEELNAKVEQLKPRVTPAASTVSAAAGPVVSAGSATPTPVIVTPAGDPLSEA
jgi:poly(hydroxyalkanoate) granule-associated protein